MNFAAMTDVAALLIVASSGITFATQLRTTLKQRCEHIALASQAAAIERLDQLIQGRKSVREVSGERAADTAPTEDVRLPEY